jgi:hypothetical protein
MKFVFIVPIAEKQFEIRKWSSDWGYYFLMGLTEWVSPSSHRMKETDLVSETLCFLVFRIPDDGHSPKTQWLWAKKSDQ